MVSEQGISRKRGWIAAIAALSIHPAPGAPQAPQA